jgi:hypothetical protein
MKGRKRKSHLKHINKWLCYFPRIWFKVQRIKMARLIKRQKQELGINRFLAAVENGSSKKAKFQLATQRKKEYQKGKEGSMGQRHEFFCLMFFQHWGDFEFFSKIFGDIRKSRSTTGR